MPRKKIKKIKKKTKIIKAKKKKIIAEKPITQNTYKSNVFKANELKDLVN